MQKPGRKNVKRLFLARSSVVNFSKEVLRLIVVSELLKPQGEDSPMNNEKNTQKTNVINTEPFAGTIGGNGGSAGHDDGHDSGKASKSSLLEFRGLHGHGKRSDLASDTECYIISIERERYDKNVHVRPNIHLLYKHNTTSLLNANRN
jgi:hypothetical protein